MLIKINGIWYISVKGIAKAYEKKETDTINYHINKNSNIFSGHVINLYDSTDLKRLGPYFTPKQLKAHGKWLDKFAFVEIGTLLNP